MYLFGVCRLKLHCALARTSREIGKKGSYFHGQLPMTLKKNLQRSKAAYFKGYFYANSLNWWLENNGRERNNFNLWSRNLIETFKFRPSNYFFREEKFHFAIKSCKLRGFMEIRWRICFSICEKLRDWNSFSKIFL